MAAKANDRDLLVSYREADPLGRVEIVFANYHIFPKVIRKMEKKTQYKIKAEREYVRSHNRGELGVRVQMSNLSDTTADEAVVNVMLEEAFETGIVDTGTLYGIDNAAEYEALVHGLSITVSLGIQKLMVYGDSLVVISQINKDWDCSTDSMGKYCAAV